jgi:ABC-2 type transport system ATP-binding protein
MQRHAAVHVDGLSKQFGDLWAVCSVSFRIGPGELYSLLGPNGAGKTTIISMLTCLVRPSDGDATVLGNSIHEAPNAVKAAIGVVPQEIALYGDMSARRNLRFWGRMYGLRGSDLERRIDQVLATIGLTDRQHDKVETYSGGMKRRVNIAAALLHRPSVLIMDEPTVGIDPQSRRHILDTIKALRDEGKTILYTTHYMEEAEELSDRIGIMDKGSLIAEGTHAELVRIVGELDRVTIHGADIPPELVERWNAVPGVEDVALTEGAATVLARDSRTSLGPVVEAGLSEGLRLSSIEIEKPDLEAVFLHLTGRVLRD